MRSIAPAAVLALVLALTGCAPNTDEAYKNCFDVLKLSVTLDDTLTDDEVIDALTEVAQTCADAAKADPEAFIDEWG